MEIERTSCIGNSIITASGRYFDYLNPLREQIDIEDIAKALSNTCRFGGHCDFYSVAEHSVLCYELARMEDASNFRHQKNALLHDAAEAYIGDMPKPLKNIMPDFEKMEKLVESVIEEAFSLKWSPGEKDRIKFLDLCLLRAERKALFPNVKENWPVLDLIPDVDLDILGMGPKAACKRFLDVFYDLEITLSF